MKMRITFSLIYILMLLVCCVARAEEPDIFNNPTWQEPVDITFNDTPFDQAFKYIIEPTGTRYTIENPDLKQLIITNMIYKELPRHIAFRMLLKGAEFYRVEMVYRVENNNLIIGVKPGSDSPWLKHVNIDVSNKRLRDVIPNLFKSVGFNFTLDPAAADLVVNSLILTDVPFVEAFNKLLQGAGAKQDIEARYVDSDIIKISPKQTPAIKDQAAGTEMPTAIFPGVTVTRIADNADPLLRRVSVDAENALLGDMINSLLRGTGLNYAVEPGVTMHMTVKSFKLTDVTFREALEKIVAAGDATLRIDQTGIVLIGAKSPPVIPKKNINLEVKDLLLSQVMELFFKDTGVNYAIDPDISRMRVTATLTNIPFGTALDSLTSAAGLTYLVEKGVYRITAQKKPTPAPVSNNSENTTGQQPGQTTGKIQTKAPQTWISLKVQIEVTQPAKDKIKKKKSAGYPMVSVLEGETATISVTKSAPGGADGKSQMVGITSVALTPTISTDGRINVSGIVDYVDSGYSARNVKILTVLKPGKAQKLPTINIPSTEDRTKAAMDLTITASLIKE